MWEQVSESIESYGIRLLNVYRETICDGPGLHYSIYLAGCRHACPGCHNPSSWDPEAGVLMTDSILGNIIREINANPLLDGITLSGGDPFYNPAGLTCLLQRLRASCTLPIWCYTGYTLEQLKTDVMLSAPLALIDVLVDGPFVRELFDPTLLWRGSSNQCIIRLHEN